MPGTPALPKTLNEALSLAERNHPAIKQAQHEVAAAEIAIERAKAAMKPRLTAGAVCRPSDSGTDNASVNLKLSGPIYQGGQLASQTAGRRLPTATPHVPTCLQETAGVFAACGAGLGPARCGARAP